MPHTVHPDEIADIRAWLLSVLPLTMNPNDARIEIEFRLQRALDAVTAAETVALFGKRHDRPPADFLARSACTMRCVWSGGTTLSLSPWKNITGH